MEMLNINGINYVPVTPIGDRVLVRTRLAGVHVGTLVSRANGVVRLERANRIWKWTGAFTLSEVATRGVGDGSRIACEVPWIDLTDSDVCEVIPVNEAVQLTERGTA